MTELGDDPIEALFHQAVELPPGERAALLDSACRDDPDLRAEVESLLACDTQISSCGNVLESPLVRTIHGPPVFGPPAAPGEVGTLGPYRIVKELGRGGMGAVYAAADTRLGRRLALKVMLPQYAADASARERFLREARAVAQITHDNVVTIYEADERDGIPFIAMQFLEGQPLNEYLRENGAPPLDDVLRIAQEAAAGLDAAHRIGLVHRDIKPANLWLEAPHGRVKVLDFGLAKPADTEIEITGSGAVVGTPAYMSPEQARGEKVDRRTDLFSLGAVLYRLCSGRLPFDGPTTMSVLTALATEEPPPVLTLCPAAPAPLAELIHQLLAKRPDARPSSAAEVVKRVRAIVDAPTATARGVAASPSSLAPSRAARKRRHLMLAGGMIFAGLCLLAAAVYFWQTPDGRVVRIECDDPSIKIAFEGGEFKVTGAYKEPITFKPGHIGLKIKKGDDFEFETDKLIVHKGDKIVLRIEVALGKVQIVQAGKGVLDSKLLLSLDTGEPWETAVARMDAKDQVTAVAIRLKKLNPKFDETSLSQKIENGVVVTLAVGDASGLKDLTPLRALAGLKDLHLHGRFVGAADIGPLRGMKLVSFQSNGCPHRDLSPLAGMPLTKANFWGIATTDLSPLRGMKLVETNVGHSSIKDISVMKGMPLEIVCLNISHVEDLSPLAGAPLKRLFAANIKAKDLGPVANAPIEWLCINGTPIEDLTPLLTMPLQALEMDDPQRHAKLLRKIPTLKTINHKPVGEVLGGAIERTDPDRHAAEWALRLGGIVWVDARQGDIKDIADLPKDRFTVTNVDVVYKPAVTDASLLNLRGLKGLKLLNLGGTSVTDEGLVHLKEHTGLTHLVLERLKLTKTGLAHLRDLNALQVLHLHSVPLSDDGLSEFMGLKKLTTLDLSHARLTEAGLARLKQFKALSILALRDTAATDDTVEHLKELELTSLHLSETKLTDIGLARLKHFKGLRSLWVEKTAVTAQGLADFHAAVPGCRIHHDGGIFEAKE